ncbi:SET and MYND domain-containing protein 4 [Protopterus annectens]|uniref:SET and MYND domain-containing protein 4 n=1 Tax=Protopterus annectens TaxID=7888 RepID=UPI001CF9A780|nr:SET and MYND domain-containing protein 4 [Protopterus annectens]
MDGVPEWLNYVSCKWSQLESSSKECLTQATDLQEIFNICLSLFSHEDEVFLEKLAGLNLLIKNSKAVLFYKEKGNEKFQKKCYLEAVALYSKGISNATPGTEDIAVCYANRSAALYYLKEYEKCLGDIQQALSHGYPKRLEQKILVRRNECLQHLSKLDKTTTIASDLRKRTGNHPELPNSVTQSHRNIKTDLHYSAEDGASTLMREKTNATKPCEINPRVPCASAVIKLHFSTSKGRHLLAEMDINAGDSLIVEEAFVSVLIPAERKWLQVNPKDSKEMWDTSINNEDLCCHHCLERTLSPVTCLGCCFTRYCSEECREQAWNVYHKTECTMGSLLIALGVFSHVALRTVLTAGFKKVKETHKQWYSREQQMLQGGPSQNQSRLISNILEGSEEQNGQQQDIPILGCDVTGSYHSSYLAIYHLLTHTEKHLPEHRFLCGMTVAAICKQLQRVQQGPSIPTLSTADKDCSANKGGDKGETDGSLDLKIMGTTVLRHLFQLHCNAQAITAIRDTDFGCSVVESNQQIRVATALFPVVSLLNHSCAQNTTVSFRGRTATVRASQPVRKGEEILHCYGPHTGQMSLKERRQVLNTQYFFECRCLACVKEEELETVGPLAQLDSFCCVKCKLLLQETKELCVCPNSSCGCVIPKTKLHLELQEIKMQIRTALRFTEDGNPDQAIQLLLRCLQKSVGFLSATHKVIGEIHDKLAQAYANIGDWKSSAAHLRSSIQVVEAHYGSCSIQCGHELLKLSQVLFNGFAMSEALDVIPKAEAILITHYGSENDMVQELQEMEACLRGMPFA